MIQVTKDELKAGQTLARPIFGPNGEIMLASGYEITPKITSKLQGSDQAHFWVFEVHTSSNPIVK